MTSPLPAQSAKSALTESKGSSKNDFFNLLAPKKKNEEIQSFESLISKNDKSQERQEELEEAENSKKRRKQIDAAAFAAQVASNSPLQATPDLENPMGIPAAQEMPSEQELASGEFLKSNAKTQPQTDSPKTAQVADKRSSLIDSQNSAPTETLANFDVAELKEVATPSEDRLTLTKKSEVQGKAEVEADDATQTVNKKNPASYNPLDQMTEAKSIRAADSALHSADGTKSAATEDDMVSLATFEDSQASYAPKTSVEPSITSANRLTVAEISERTAIRATENAGSGFNASPENFLSANPSILQADFNGVHHKGAASQATSIFKTLSPELEKFQQSGQSQVQLELPVGENESVKIRLQLRAGEIRSTFITESPELREALQKAWPDFTATHRAQGVRFGESQFQDSFARNQDAASDQGRQKHNRADTPNDLPAPQPVKSLHRATSQPSSANNSISSTINLWA